MSDSDGKDQITMAQLRAELREMEQQIKSSNKVRNDELKTRISNIEHALIGSVGDTGDSIVATLRTVVEWKGAVNKVLWICASSAVTSAFAAISMLVIYLVKTGAIK